MKIKTLLLAMLTLSLLSTAAFAQSVTLGSKEGLGKFLTDDKGMTLYYFKKDSPEMSKCAGPCLEKWPAFHGAAGQGVEGKDLGHIARDDGKTQTTFRGYPLYYFVGDKNPGDTNGQGVNEVWYVIDPQSFMKN